MGSCPEALQILRGFRQIDLLFSDIVMPGKLNGIQLAARIVASSSQRTFEKS